MQRKLIFLACFFVYTNCFAQLAESSGQYPFVYYTPKDGLVNSRVRSIKQDSKGRMIFITYGGISFYDGTHFTNYNINNGLSNDLINDVVESGPDSFLIAPNTSVLQTLVHGRIGVYHTDDNFQPVVNRFFRSANGNWYVAADEGLFLFTGKKFTRLPILNSQGIDVGHFLDRVVEWKNFFLITMWNPQRKVKLILYDIVQHKTLDIDTSVKVINCATDASGRIWTANAEKVLLIDTLSLLKGKINFLPIPENYADLPQPNSGIFIDHENNMWFYGWSGVSKISPQLQKQVFDIKHGLNTTNLSDLFVDRENIIWFATDGNGVIKINNDNVEYTNGVDNNQPVSAIASQNDTAWMFSNDEICRSYKNELTSFPLTGAKIFVNTIFAHDQRLFLSDADRLICIKNKNQFQSYRHPQTIFDARSKDISLGTMLVDENGIVIQYAKQNDSLYFLLVIKNEKLIEKYQLSYMVDQMITDKKGRLWLATRDGHIMAFVLHPEQPSMYLQLIKDYSKELPDMSPRSITLDTSGNVWIGTRYHGVYCFALENMKLTSATQFTTQNGLTDNFIYSIHCDNNNNIWVGTQTGLDKIFLKDGHYIIGNVSKNNNFFQSIHKIIVTKDNVVWALTSEGSILKIASSPTPNPSSFPHFLFTAIQINNELYTDSSIIFSFRQNNFSFNVAAPSYADERSINYSYLLDGSGNKNWSNPSNNSAFNFINLSPGHYTLKVKADFPEAMYPSQIISYSFTIKPPWWQTWWFITIFAIFIAGILTAAIRFYYTRKLERQKLFLEKQQAIEKERTRIATDMHDDLGAGLSRIKFLSETIGIKKQKQLPFEEDITKIREYSHEMIDKMGEIVWALNEKNDSLSDLLSYTRSYAAEYLSQNGIHCSIDAPDILSTFFVSGEFRRNIFLTVKEALHNVIKHSQADTVCIQIKKDKNLEITIKDNGVGFDEKKIRAFSNGIHNMKKRMNDIEGQLEITNNKGTIIKLTAPLPS